MVGRRHPSCQDPASIQMCSEVLGWVLGAETEIPVAYRLLGALPQAYAKREEGLNSGPLPQKGPLKPPMPARHLTGGRAATYSGKDQRGGKKTTSPTDTPPPHQRWLPMAHCPSVLPLTG